MTSDTEAKPVALLPCPHCGEQEHLYPGYHWPGTGDPYCIDCLGCGADFTPREGMDVIAMWNRRANPSSIRHADDASNPDRELLEKIWQIVQSGWNESAMLMSMPPINVIAYNVAHAFDDHPEVKALMKKNNPPSPQHKIKAE